MGNPKILNPEQESRNGRKYSLQRCPINKYRGKIIFFVVVGFFFALNCFNCRCK